MDDLSLGKSFPWRLVLCDSVRRPEKIPKKSPQALILKQRNIISPITTVEDAKRRRFK